MVLRLDTEMMQALEARADKARTSRESFVRGLVADALGVRSKIGSQRLWHERFSKDTTDDRVRGARNAAGNPLARLATLTRRRSPAR
jgi:hypothetical protein